MKEFETQPQEESLQPHEGNEPPVEVSKAMHDKKRLGIGGLVVLAVIGVLAWWYYTPEFSTPPPPQFATTTEEIPKQLTTTSTSTVVTSTTTQETVMSRIRRVRDYIEVPMPKSDNPGYQIYRNEEWGFEFEYSEDWEVWENSMGGASILFMIELQPANETPRMLDGAEIIFMPDKWVQSVHENIKAQGREMTNTIIQNYPAISYDSTSRGLPTKATFIRVHDDHWIYLQLTPNFGYEEAYEHMVETLQFF